MRPSHLSVERADKMEQMYKGTSIQEAFVLDMLEYKNNGFYVELGASHPTQGNNTYFLETDFNWKGVSFEINEKERSKFNSLRNNLCKGDALTFNYLKYFNENRFPKQIDFLQIDLDDSFEKSTENKFLPVLGLISLPLNQYRFSVITFEHDESIDSENIIVKDVQREILKALGYTLVHEEHYEDWWVDPLVIEEERYKRQ